MPAQSRIQTMFNRLLKAYETFFKKVSSVEQQEKQLIKNTAKEIDTAEIEKTKKIIDTL